MDAHLQSHRFPPDIISYAVWLYYRFNLSHRDIEDLPAERGTIVKRESIRLLCIIFGTLYTPGGCGASSTVPISCPSPGNEQGAGYRLPCDLDPPDPQSWIPAQRRRDRGSDTCAARLIQCFGWRRWHEPWASLPALPVPTTTAANSDWRRCSTSRKHMKHEPDKTGPSSLAERFAVMRR